MKEIIGRNLKTARELVGLSQEVLADKLGISRATLSAIENGHVAIDSTKLLLAARFLGRPVSDFFTEKVEALTLLYRAAADATAPSHVLTHFERFCKAYRELEDLVGLADTLLPPPDYSQSPGVQSKPFQLAVQLAYSERERMGLGQRDPIENILKLLDDQGVRIFRYTLEDVDVYGLSAFSSEYGPCILVNKANTVERQIFSVAHEYCHLLMHRQFYKSPEPSAALEKDHEMEQTANTFAANFLVPEMGLREMFSRDVGQKKVTLEDIVFLKRSFRVSAEVMVRRLADLGLLSKVEADRLLEEIDKHREPKKEFAPLSDGLIREWEQGSRFQHLARKAALGEMISLGKLAELLGITLVEARKKVQEWRREIAFAQA